MHPLSFHTMRRHRGLGRRWYIVLVSAIAVVANVSIRLVQASDTTFNPYDLNGGLVAAVAGRDYMVLATDTRLVGGSGMDILERHHVRSRIWAAAAPQRMDGGTGIVAPDGSLHVQRHGSVAAHIDSPSLRLVQESISRTCPPVWIGTGGCQADCEELKRTVQRTVRAAQYFGEVALPSIPPDQMAVLLSNVLYSKRFFPYYSFCIVAGLHDTQHGHVYSYDAVGSYEPLAATCVGQGHELMQPILDQVFFSAAMSPHCRHGPASLHVDCPTPEHAVQHLVHAYRSVAERDVAVGDHVVLYTVQRRSTRHGPDEFHAKIWTSALKKD